MEEWTSHYLDLLQTWSFVFHLLFGQHLFQMPRFTINGREEIIVDLVNLCCRHRGILKGQTGEDVQGHELVWSTVVARKSVGIRRELTVISLINWSTRLRNCATWPCICSLFAFSWLTTFSIPLTCSCNALLFTRPRILRAKREWSHLSLV